MARTGPLSGGVGPNRNECRVLRRLRCRPQRHPGRGIPRRRVQLPAHPGPGRGRLRRLHGGGVPVRGHGDHRRQPGELGAGLRTAGPADRGPCPDLPGRRPPGQRPGPLPSGVDLLPDRRVLRRRPTVRSHETGERSRACFAEAAALAGSTGGADRSSLRGGIAPRLSGTSAGPGWSGLPGGSRRLDPRSSGWAASTRVPKSSTSTSGPRAPSAAGTSSCSTVPASRDACAETPP